MATTKDLNYYKTNCEEDYLTTPISVLRYITELEEALSFKHPLIGYWFSNEHGNKVTVLHFVDEWCMVEDDTKDEPYLLPLEYIQSIKKDSDNYLEEQNKI